jgi:hypothetical protein
MATPTTLPATFVAGDVLTAAQQNALRGAFRILQVVYASTTTETSTTSATYATTSLAGTITPSATSSKILIFTNSQLSGNSAAMQTGIRIFDGSTAVLTNPRAIIQNAAGDLALLQTMIYLDSPNTTSAKTYTLQFARTSGSGTVVAQPNSGPSTMILCEVSA